jgi:hypothetical protein
MSMVQYESVTVVLSADETDILLESLWHAVQRGDISDQDRRLAYALRERLRRERRRVE